MRKRGAQVLAAIVAGLVLLPAHAAADDYRVCGGQAVQPWQGESTGQAVSIPSLAHPVGIDTYEGSIFKPADPVEYPGRRPLVVLQHGINGGQCALYWAARLLAGHGYVTMIWKADANPVKEQAFVNAVDAMRSAIAFARTPSNPFGDVTDTDRIGLGGHSMGSIVTSLVQGDGDPGVRAAIASDNLRKWISGDPGAASEQCANPMAGEVSPTVPALGFAKDEPCNSAPDYAPPDLKQSGFRHWRSAGVPSMELVMRGFDHEDFSAGGSEQQHRYLAHYYLAWYGYWLDGDSSQLAELLSETVDGVPTESILSSRFLSGAFLPDADPPVDTTDFVSWLGSDRVAPQIEGRRPSSHGRITRRAVQHRGLTFRFAADEPASFECRFDDRAWTPCESPKHRRRASLGRHDFRARATDLAGNVSSAVRWTFRIVRKAS